MIAPICLVVGMMGVLAAARSTSAPVIRALPNYLLPGSPAPADVTCYPMHYGQCQYSVLYGDDLVYLAFNGFRTKIVSAVIPAHGQTIGDMILAWGMPTGFSQNGFNVEVSWGSRTAVLITCSFQPTSLVGYFRYDMEPVQVPPWRGFVGGQVCGK